MNPDSKGNYSHSPNISPSKFEFTDTRVTGQQYSFYDEDEVSTFLARAVFRKPSIILTLFFRYQIIQAFSRHQLAAQTLSP